jgi:hypothetical protein
MDRKEENIKALHREQIYKKSTNRNIDTLVSKLVGSECHVNVRVSILMALNIFIDASIRI